MTGSIDKKSITEKKKNREEKYKRARTSVGQEKGEFNERVSIIGTTNLKKKYKREHKSMASLERIYKTVQ